MPPVIDPDKCNKCGVCVDLCSEDVFYSSRKDEIPTVTYPEECIHFAGCVYNCPTQAITLRIPLPMLLVYKPSEKTDLP